ncbi:MAG: TadE family protein [Planctomycetaceae bacterium]
MHRLIVAPKGDSTADRRGAAAVEFALVAPVFVALVIGAIQAGFNLDSTTKMYAAIRQSGRLASLDYDSKLLPNQSINAKIIQDIKNSLTAEGLPGDKMSVSITYADGAKEGSSFDLGDPNNDLLNFRIGVAVNYSDVNSKSVLPSNMNSLNASVVFRKGRSALVE